MNTNIEISTTNSCIIDSGTIIVPEGEYIEFKIQNLRFRFSFNFDESATEGSIAGKIQDEGEGEFFHIVITNYLHMFATPGKALNVGMIEDKTLSVRFSVVKLSSSDSESAHIFHYTWYKSK